VVVVVVVVVAVADMMARVQILERGLMNVFFHVSSDPATLIFARR
jgi:hypothetical protein